MQLYSQKDPKWANVYLPKSSLTMGNYGCYVTSIAMLGQVEPTSLLLSYNFANGGLLYSSRAANSAGIKFLRSSSSPGNGWQIAVTDHYKSQGFPTHFFCVNTDKGLQIDPLKKDPKVEKLSYKIIQYRLFENVKLQSQTTSEQIDAAMKLNSEAWQQLEAAQDKLHKSNNLLRSL